MPPQRVVIIGAAGQAREVAWYLEESNRQLESFKLLGFVVSDLARLGPNDSQPLVLGDFAWLSDHRRDIDGLILGVGTPAARLRLARDLSGLFPEFAWPSVSHPSAVVHTASCTLGRGTMLGAGVVATVNVVLEDFAMLNFGCTVGHETRVGRGAVVNPGASISGGVTIGEGALIGAGAVVLQYRSVGRAATVGAGAVVTKDVPPETTVVGVPAIARRSGS